MTRKKVRAIVLFSGGLDSILAAKLLQEQKIEVIGLNFFSPFFSEKNAVESAKQLKIELIKIDLSKEQFHEYTKLLRNPKHGYGSAMNPCIDCHLFMIKKAGELLKKFKADFVATGEVLDERPMSQNLHAIHLIERESGLQGKLLRPLSAKLLPETDVEQQGLVDRNKLLDIHGRSRQKQLALAKKYKLKFPTPAGGCILCEQEFAKKLRDLLEHKKNIEPRDLELLKIGRHFRVGGAKIIVARNEQESDKLWEFSGNDMIFEVKNAPGPTTLLQGKESAKIIQVASELTAAYSDARNLKDVVVEAFRYGGIGIVGRESGKLNKSLKTKFLSQEKIEKLRIK